MVHPDLGVERRNQSVSQNPVMAPDHVQSASHCAPSVRRDVRFTRLLQSVLELEQSRGRKSPDISPGRR